MPTATPLTDAINALTQYANETTGASDTTLSDAVGTLVAGYGGTGIKGSTLFPWMVDGIVDSSEAFGGLGVNTEANGRSNLATMETDGYLRIYNTSGGNGRVVITTANMITQYAYDYVLMHIVSLTTTTNNQPLTWGGKTAKSATAPTVGIYTLGNGYKSLTDKWVAVPLVMVTSGNYFAFGGTVDCRIDKIYFVKVKS